jgi:hypothetical protein
MDGQEGLLFQQAARLVGRGALTREAGKHKVIVRLQL